jgi:twinkle protein
MSKNIFRAKDVKEEMMHGYLNGKERGSTTHIKNVDPVWTWRKTDVNIFTGYQNEGKSLFLEQLMSLKSYYDGWKHALFTPENVPITDFYDNIIEMLVGKSCDPFYKGNLMTEKEYLNAIDFVDKFFFIVYPQGEWTLNNVLECFKELKKDENIDTATIDPYNKIHHELSGERGDIYVSNFMTECKRFAIDNNVAFQLVAHQLTARKDENGKYVKPDLNYIKGGGAFADGADNVCFVWRPDRAIDFSSTAVVFGSQKIKKQKLVGIPGDVWGVDFKRKENRYYFDGISGMKDVVIETDYKPKPLTPNEDCPF